MAPKIAFFFANEAFFLFKVAYLKGFDLLRTKICVIKHIWRASSGKKTIELEKFKMAAKTGSAAKVETNSLIGLHLNSLT